MQQGTEEGADLHAVAATAIGVGDDLTEEAVGMDAKAVVGRVVQAQVFKRDRDHMVLLQRGEVGQGRRRVEGRDVVLMEVRGQLEPVEVAGDLMV